MRGHEDRQQYLFSYVSMEERIPKDHPLRALRKMVDAAFEDMSGHFSAIYSTIGRPSIAPEQLLRAMLLQVLYTIRSERLLVEQLEYNLLFRWFVGLSMDGKVWNHSTFSKNRDRLLDTESCYLFFKTIREQATQLGLVSNEHFTVDGTLLEAWASVKSFQPKDQDGGLRPGGPGRNASVDFRGKRRTNATHRSTTDPDARLYKKANGQQAKLCHLGHVLMENRNGLVVDATVTKADGTAERKAAIEMIAQIPGRHRITIGADKGYDCHSFIEACRQMNATAHVARKRKYSAIDGRPPVIEVTGSACKCANESRKFSVG
jgi:transposase